MSKKKYAYECIGCHNTFEDTKLRAVCPTCVSHAMSNMTIEQYRQWLIHNRNRILEGLPLKSWDDETIGDKDTYVSWGACSDDVAAFTDPETWGYGPATEPNHWDKTRIRTISLPKGKFCPFDLRLTGEGDPRYAQSGCFYSCRVFGGKVRKDDRERALQLYDKAIESLGEEKQYVDE
jgi:hypothetical protein